MQQPVYHLKIAIEVCLTIKTVGQSIREEVAGHTLRVIGIFIYIYPTATTRNNRFSPNQKVPKLPPLLQREMTSQLLPLLLKSTAYINLHDLYCDHKLLVMYKEMRCCHTSAKHKIRYIH